MEKANLEREVQELRRQIEVLSAKKSDEAKAGDSVADAGASTETESDLGVVQAKIEQLLESLKQDLREVPATTAVGIFALGVLLGRLLPR